MIRLSTIDVSSLPKPDIVETLSFESVLAELKADYQERYPEFSADLESEPAVKLLEVAAYRETLLRARINDAARAVLAPLAKKNDLDVVAARVNVARLVLEPATDTEPAVMEGDASLLRRYLLRFDNPSAGSRNRYLYEAWTAWPEMGDAVVNGRAIHGRTGDTDIVIIGPGGRVPSDDERALVASAVLSPSVVPESTSAALLVSSRREYAANLRIEIPKGPDAELVRQQAIARVKAATDARTVIGGEIPEDFIKGVAYGQNVIKVHDLAAVAIEPEPYTTPVCTAINISVEVRE